MTTSNRQHGNEQSKQQGLSFRSSHDGEPPARSQAVANGRRRKSGRLNAAAAAGLVLGTAMTMTAILGPAPAPASAAAALPFNGPVVTMVEETTDLDLDSPKSVTAYCRGGTKLIGAGFSRNSGGSGVVVDEAVPTVGQVGLDDHVEVTAYQTPAGAPFAWSLKARAFCASGMSNVRVIRGESLMDTSVPKTAEAECPFGTKVVGTAFEGLFAAGEVVVTKIDPVPGSGVVGDKVIVTAYPDDNGIAGSWGVAAYAFCATAPPGLEIVSRTLTPSGNGGHTTVKSCPGTKAAIGAGAYISSAAAGNVLLYGLTIFEVFNGGQGASASSIPDANGTTAAWNLTTKAICANQ